jgi:MSHA biogenesis protein MshJ
MKVSRSLDFIGQLKPRERVFAALALLALVYFVLEFSVWRPERLEEKALHDEMATNKVQSTALAKALQSIGPAFNVPSGLRAEREQLARAIARADGLLARGNATAETLRVASRLPPGVKLVSLRTLPTETVSVSAPAAPAAAGASAARAAATQAPAAEVFRSGIEVMVEGTYPALVSYLAELERNSGGLLWGEMNLTVGNYPSTTLKLTLYSLATRQTGLIE